MTTRGVPSVIPADSVDSPPATEPLGSEGQLASYRDRVRQAIELLDLGPISRAYREQDEFVAIESFLEPSLLTPLLDEVNRLRPLVHRNYVPRFKKGGSISYFELLKQAPMIQSLYHSPALLRFAEELTGSKLMVCPEDDPHSCALYYYTEPGDHIGFHYDTSHYKGVRYTLLLGLVDRSSSEIVARLYTKQPGRDPVEVRQRTAPGTLVFFHCDKLYHRVSPLGSGEERVILTMEYVTDASISPWLRLFWSTKDAIMYFGLGSVVRSMRKALR